MSHLVGAACCENDRWRAGALDECSRRSWTALDRKSLQSGPLIN